ncbi:MAG: hypothetical protein H0X33_14400 [Taibaiella sp.]|nr:hypothetical protein [Taibaiella sp.]
MVTLFCRQPDPHITTYINAVNGSGYTLGGTEKAGIAAFVKTLKDNSLWGRMKAIYPMAGNTAASQKWNILDARDLDASYRLTYVASPSHTSNGLKGDGATSYTRTHLNMTTDVDYRHAHIGVFVQENNRTGADMGELINAGGSYGSGSFLSSTAGDGNSYGSVGYPPIHSVSSAHNVKSMWLVNRTGNTETFYEDGTLIDTYTLATVGGYGEMYIGAINYGGTADNFCNRTQSFVTIGGDLTATEYTTVYLPAIQALMTAFGRS